MAEMRLTSGKPLVAVVLAGLALPGFPVALAQQAPPTVAQAVVQPVPGRDGLSLNAALARLAQNPRDGAALVDAGAAALAMGDVDAAIGFYRRADEVMPGNPRVKAGLAGALVRNENPFDAIPLFAEAERAGLADATAAADRGLAYDLVGDNETAQRHYRAALARESSDEVFRRLALSQAMAGDLKSAETTLSPLVARQDKASLRTRAFVLAIAGRTDDAVGIAYASLPADLAAAISPYLRYMPRLTPAQQAAAANFGHFPRASEIGRDDPRVARFAPPGGRRPVAVASADAALIPKGEPLGRNARNRNARNEQREGRAAAEPASARSRTAAAAATREAPPEVQPSRATLPSPTASVLVSAAPPPIDLPAAPPRRETPPRREAAVAAGSAAVATATAEPSAGELPPLAVTTAPQLASSPPSSPPAAAAAATATQPGFATLESASPSRPAATTPVPAASPPAPIPAARPDPVLASAAAPEAAPQAAPAATVAASPPPAAPPRPRSLAEAFADLAAAPAEVAPAPGAVDIRRITPAREAPRAEEAKPAPPSHPSRIWVQVATGRDKDALAFDWRRMTRSAADTFRGKSPFVSNWGRTNRLLTGPFPSEAAASQFIAQLRKADIDGAFVWTSPAGQVVDALPGR